MIWQVIETRVFLPGTQRSLLTVRRTETGGFALHARLVPQGRAVPEPLANHLAPIPASYLAPVGSSIRASISAPIEPTTKQAAQRTAGPQRERTTVPSHGPTAKAIAAPML